ncbi:MAG: thiamine-binding protein [Thermotogae bacterium]|nr:thiamine-binding protein [Thermotogota bacterium]
MTVTMSIQLIPIVSVEKKLHEIVDEAIKVINTSGLKFKVNAHSTIVEGDFEELLELAKKVKEKIGDICERFVLNIQFDISKRGVTIDEKTEKYG